MVHIELPEDLHEFRLPKAVDMRLQMLLDRQDRGGFSPPRRGVRLKGW